MSRFYDAMAKSAGKKIEPAERIERGPKTIEDVERIAPDAPEVGEVVAPHRPEWQSEHQSELPIDDQQREPKTEPTSKTERPIQTQADEAPIRPAYERIIQRLLGFRKAPRQGVIMVAGAVRGEGTSTIARNTALALGQGRSERIVLVDANLRHPVQHQVFGLDPADGLVDVLRGPVSLSGAVNANIGSGVSLLTAGSPCESPPTLLTVSSLQAVAMALASLFDWVIIDSPPLTQYPEAASIASACAGAMLVIRAEKTRSEVGDEAKKILVDSGVEVLGAILNRRRFHIPGFIYRRL